MATSEEKRRYVRVALRVLRYQVAYAETDVLLGRAKMEKVKNAQLALREFLRDNAGVLHEVEPA